MEFKWLYIAFAYYICKFSVNFHGLVVISTFTFTFRFDYCNAEAFSEIHFDSLYNFDIFDFDHKKQYHIAN